MLCFIALGVSWSNYFMYSTLMACVITSTIYNRASYRGGGGRKGGYPP